MPTYHDMYRSMYLTCIFLSPGGDSGGGEGGMPPKALWRADIAFATERTDGHLLCVPKGWEECPVAREVFLRGFAKEGEFFIRRAKSHSVKRVAWRWCGLHFFRRRKGPPGEMTRFTCSYAGAE